MSAVRELLLERMLNQTRLAVLEDGKLCEIYFAHGESGKLSGNIYAGRVQNILPGMNAAFVDIGLNRNGFLYAGDIHFDTRGDKELQAQLEGRRIEKMLRPGQMIVVQVTKEPGGSKGPRLSCNLSLPGKLAVLLPSIRYAGVSNKISDEAERNRLHKLARNLCEQHGAGLIVRTAAENVSEEALREDYLRLLRDWQRIENEAQHSAKPRLIQSDSDLALFAVRELLDESVKSVRTDDKTLYEQLKHCADALAPTLRDRLELVSFDCPLFDLMRVDHQLENAFARRVNLKSGGTLVFDETEAMTVVDVNTARFTGSKSIDETVFRLNCEAADEIARQIRLRDIGGIIIVDFIDMKGQEQKDALLEHMKEALKNDRNRTCVVDMTPLGLVEITRKKLRKPLSKLLQRDCALCAGSGRVFTNEAKAYQAARELWRRRRMGDTSLYKLSASAALEEYLDRIGLIDDKLRIEIDAAQRDYALIPVERNAAREDRKTDE